MTNNKHDKAVEELTKVLILLGITWNTRNIASSLVDIGVTLIEASKQGTWKYYSHTMMECSICGRHTAKHKYKYCPHCGAEMKGEITYD